MPEEEKTAEESASGEVRPENAAAEEIPPAESGAQSGPDGAREDAEDPGAAAEKDPRDEKIFALEERAKAAEDRALRTLADFDNFRKRSLRDREEFAKTAAAEAVKAVLPTADNLEKALANAKDGDPFVKGVKMSYESFISALASLGAERMETDGADFDPNLHEALAQTPSGAVPAGKIAETYRAGWMLNGRLLRAAQVLVSSGPAEQKED